MMYCSPSTETFRCDAEAVAMPPSAASRLSMLTFTEVLASLVPRIVRACSSTSGSLLLKKKKLPKLMRSASQRCRPMASFIDT